VILGVSICTSVSLNSSVILLPMYFLCLFFMSYGLSLVAALLYVYFRDLKHILALVMQLWFYGTPVFYNPDMIPPKYHWILLANPVGGCFVGLHKILAYGEWPPTESILSSLVWGFVLLGFGLIVFKRVHRNVIEHL
jgi:lipopolysaccharide transport system permease protein